MRPRESKMCSWYGDDGEGGDSEAGADHVQKD